MVTVCASRKIENTQPTNENPPRSPTNCGIAVATMVESIATSAMANISATNTGVRWSRRGINTRLPFCTGDLLGRVQGPARRHERGGEGLWRGDAGAPSKFDAEIAVGSAPLGARRLPDGHRLRCFLTQLHVACT